MVSTPGSCDSLFKTRKISFPHIYLHIKSIGFPEFSPPSFVLYLSGCNIHNVSRPTTTTTGARSV